MWLPTSAYERLPLFWMLVGVLFMTSAAYLGFDYPLSSTYLGLGLLSVVWSGCVLALRLRRRKNRESAADHEESGDETNEQPH